MTANILKQAERALMNLEAEILVSLYDDEFKFMDTAAGKSITDKAELMAYYSQLFAMPDVKFTEVSFFGSGSRVAGQWTWQGTSLKSGKSFSICGASLFRIKKDKIEEEIVFYDPRKAYE
jgi:steroid delta-isomerase-like uncharacterized protein